MPVMEGLTAIKVATAEYDFTVDTGAIAAYTLRGVGVNGGAIPNGSIITGGEVDVLTAFTTGTAATMAISIEGANDLISATVVSGAPYSTTGQKSIIPVGTGATMIKTTAARSIVATIATGTVTAGKLRVRLTYI
jgi:hypothetical protein